MDFLLVAMIILLLVGVLFALTPKPGEKGGADLGDKFFVKRKQCPPHQWFWQEIVDQNGVKHGERIVCKVCGPLQSSSGSSEE